MQIDIEKIKQRNIELNEKLASSEVLSKPSLIIQISKELSENSEIINLSENLDKLNQELFDAEELFSKEKDLEIKELAEIEIQSLKDQIQDIEKKLTETETQIKKDPKDDKNGILEIRAGAGGEEASLFAADLFRMYSRYSESKGWNVEMLNSNKTENGGFKEVCALIEGRGVYGKLKFEKGVHRVQRVPVTESAGRIHTSTATVAVLAEQQEIEIEIKPEDLRIDVFRAGGAGGQCVNTTDSAVRITHIPTGTVVSCQDRKSQLKNREAALKVLKSRLFEAEQEKEAKQRSEQRKSQVGTGERSEKIRTYNYPQDRITDHRIKVSWHNIPKILGGELDEIVDTLQNAAREKDSASN